jgi:hypothetical protein
VIPELGNFAVICALCIAFVQAIVPLAGAARGNVAWMNVARPAAQGQFVFVAIAFGCLVYSFLNNDFSVLNVAIELQLDAAVVLPDHRNLGQPRRVAAALGADAGRLDAGGFGFQPSSAAGDAGTHPRRDGSGDRSASCCSCCSPRIRSTVCCRRLRTGAISIRCCRIRG